jgi:hypothetical protein
LSKRALMLTAAAAALLSGQSLAQTTITNKVSSPQSTSSDGTITITSTGSIVITTNPPTTPAVTINGGTTPGTAADVINEGKIDYLGVGSATNPLTGIDMVTGNTGGLDNVGTIDFTGAGNTKTGILVSGTSAFLGNITETEAGTALDTITGIPDANSAAILIEENSTLKVQGDDSIGINVASGAALGSTATPSDIDIIGSLEMTPTSASSTSSQSYAIEVAGTMYGNINLASSGIIKVEGNGASYGIYIPASTVSLPAGVLNGDLNIDGELTMSPISPASVTSTGNAGIYMAGVLNGDINVGTSGEISSSGEGAQGIVVSGTVNGFIENQGDVSTFGISTASTNGDNPQSGSALNIGGSVSGGIYNAGPNGEGSTTASATLDTIGNAATLLIEPSSTATGPVVIGSYTDQGDTGSLLNRGTIANSSENADASTFAVSISGASTVVPVTFQSGIFNAGSITATSTTDAKGSFNIGATGLLIGSNATVPFLTNSNEDASKAGVISAAISGLEGGQAHAIEIDSGGSLPTILNQGTISASASTTNTQLSNSAVQAYAIFDSSGTLTSITNASGATIEALATTISDNSQVSQAINTEANTTGVTVNNSGTIIGDLDLGSGADTVTVSGLSAQESAILVGSLYFGGTVTGTNDSLIVGNNGTVTGQIYAGTTTNPTAGLLDVSIEQGGTLNLLTADTKSNPKLHGPLTEGVSLTAGHFDVAANGNLDIHYAQNFNLDLFSTAIIINAENEATILDNANVTFTADSFIAPPVGDKSAQFVVIKSPDINISANELSLIQDKFISNLSYLYSPLESGVSLNGADNELLLTITPKTIGADGCKTQFQINNCNLNDIPLTGFAAKLFPYANVALGNDNALGSALVSGITNSTVAESIYSNFAPDVSGATRALAISLTDDATSVVAARQKTLREYANQDGDLTLWGQQFVQSLDQDATAAGPGYRDTGFGFALGADEGDPADGRYGGAFTFFSGGSRAQQPDLNKTTSEWYTLTGYTDWRGKGLFLDTDGSLGYVNLTGRRYLNIQVPDGSGTDTTLIREAGSQHPGELLSGGVTTGAIFDESGTVFTPQVSFDGLAMREEAYSESGGGNGMDLHVASSYAQSLRAFAGLNVRQDFDFTDFLLQPDITAGYRYDLANGAQSLKANFESVSPVSVFEITGPKPDKGNAVVGGGVAVSTGAWSLGLNFDYLKAGSGNTAEQGTITLLGRI